MKGPCYILHYKEVYHRLIHKWRLHCNLPIHKKWHSHLTQQPQSSLCSPLRHLGHQRCNLQEYPRDLHLHRDVKYLKKRFQVGTQNCGFSMNRENKFPLCCHHTQMSQYSFFFRSRSKILLWYNSHFLVNLIVVQEEKNEYL